MSIVLVEGRPGGVQPMIPGLPSSLCSVSPSHLQQSEILILFPLSERGHRQPATNISSSPGDAKQIGHAVRSHWGAGNGLHWVMDMVFRDDERRIRRAHAPENFATIKHLARNLPRRGKGKHSMRASRHIPAWNEDFLYSLLTT